MNTPYERRSNWNLATTSLSMGSLVLDIHQLHSDLIKYHPEFVDNELWDKVFNQLTLLVNFDSQSPIE